MLDLVEPAAPDVDLERADLHQAEQPLYIVDGDGIVGAVLLLLTVGPCERDRRHALELPGMR